MKNRQMGLLAQRIKDAGRYGDTELVHMNKDEKAMLDRMSPHGEATINPETGLPEYFSLGKVVKGAKKAVKGVVKGAKGVVSGALHGNIGDIAMLVAGVYTGGAALGAWGAGTTSAFGAMGAGGQGFWSTVGSNLSTTASNAFSYLSGSGAAGPVTGAAAEYGPTMAELGVSQGAKYSIGGMLSGVGSAIQSNPAAFKIAGTIGASMLSADAQAASDKNQLEIAKNRTRWDNQATAENYADSNYFGQDVGFKAPDYARQLMRPDGSQVYGRSGLVSRRLNEAS